MWNRYALNSTVNTLVTGTYHIHFFADTIVVQGFYPFFQDNQNTAFTERVRYQMDPPRRNIVWLSTLVSATFGHLDSTVVKIEPMVKNQHGG